MKMNNIIIYIINYFKIIYISIQIYFNLLQYKLKPL